MNEQEVAVYEDIFLNVFCLTEYPVDCMIKLFGKCK